jgi:Protein of unknown function (DUF2934)
MLQRLASDSAVSRGHLEAAVYEVEKARIAYSLSRNALAQQLLNLPLRGLHLAAPEPSPVQTGEVARLLWEFVGMPEGTAEHDWYRAEEIIRGARQDVCDKGCRAEPVAV